VQFLHNCRVQYLSPSPTVGGEDTSTRTLQTTGLVRQKIRRKVDDLRRISEGWEGLVFRW